ncbi:MAG: NAD(P)H-dependent oxidoreductase [Bacillota bacterium]
MKIVGMNFSSRKDGNCFDCVDYCLKQYEKLGHHTEVLNFFDYQITPCGLCGYQCFQKEQCIKADDASKLFEKLIDSDIIISAIPTFRGHLASSYFILSERGQGVFRKSFDYDKDYLRKINLIVIGNLSSGADMALHEAFYDFTNKDFYPESVLLSSREYGRRSIKGDLIEDELVRNKLDKYVNTMISKYI